MAGDTTAHVLLIYIFINCPNRPQLNDRALCNMSAGEAENVGHIVLVDELRFMCS